MATSRPKAFKNRAMASQYVVLPAPGLPMTTWPKSIVGVALDIFFDEFHQFFKVINFT